MRKILLALCLAHSLILAGCVAKKPDIAPRGEHWPAPTSQGAVYYQPRLMASQDMARKALADVAPLLGVPGRRDSAAVTHSATPDILVLERAWTQHEFQPAEEPHWCRGLMWDCPIPPDVSVMVRKTDKAVIDLHTLKNLRLFDDGRLEIVHDGQTTTVSVADPSAQTLLADALFTLGSPRGYVHPAQVHYRAHNLTPKQAEDLDLSGGVLITDVAVGGPAWNAGLRHADVALSLDGLPATPSLLDRAFAGDAPVAVAALRWHKEGKRPRLVTEMLALTILPAPNP